MKPEAVILMAESVDGKPASGGTVLNENGMWFIVVDD
jgi:hypothetical protein